MYDRNAPSTPETPTAPVVSQQPPRVGRQEVKSRRPRRAASLFDPRILGRAVVDSFKKLNPRHQAKNPVMFVVEVGSVVTTVEWIRTLFDPKLSGDQFFVLAVTIWLWFTVLFANFAEAMAEGRGKAQADTLRRAQRDASQAPARAYRPDSVSADAL
jgi:high-affinity K+ transport system ATPase subunit B